MAEIKIAPSTDLVSIALSNVLSYRKDKKYYDLVKDWNKTIVINIIGFYPVAVIFKGDEVMFDLNIPNKVDLTVSMRIDTMMDVAYGRIGAISGVLKRKIKIKGILKIGILLKFMKVFLKSMKDIAENPNTKYFEVETK